MPGPLPVGLHHRRNIHRRDASPTIAGLYLNLLVQRPLDGDMAAAVGQLGVCPVAQVAEQVGGGRRVVAVAHAQQCRVLNQDRFASAEINCNLQILRTNLEMIIKIRVKRNALFIENYR